MDKNDDKFTSYNFLRLLLALLYQNGIYKIFENELERKLFYYWKIDGFSEIFKHLPIENTPNHKSVILYDEFSKEKNTEYVSFDKLDSTLLTLSYENFDLSLYEKNLSDNVKIKIKEIAAELAKIYKAEKTSKTKINIYGTNPNMDYILPFGNYIGYKAGFTLITDGNINKRKKEKISGTYNCYFESPYDFEETMQLESPKITYLSLQNATYAIKQGLFNRSLQYSLVFTQSLEEAKLQRIIEIANNEYNKNDSSPVKRIILK